MRGWTNRYRRTGLPMSYLIGLASSTADPVCSPWRWMLKSLIMNRVLAAILMILYEYGECSSNFSRVFTLTRCNDTGVQGHALKMKVKVTINNIGFLLIPWCISCAKMVNVAWTLKVKWPWRLWSRSSMINRDIALTTVHIWCNYGESSLNHSRVITLRRYNDLQGQGHGLEDEGPGQS